MDVITCLPGYVRLKNPYLYYDKPLAKYINIYIDTLYGVIRSKVNCKSATIMVEYDVSKTDLDNLDKNIGKAINSAIKNKKEDLSRYDKYYKTIEKKNKAKRKFFIYGLTYIAFKVKQSLYGKFSLSRNTKALQAASLVTIVGGYPLYKSIYKKITHRVPADSDVLLKLTALSFTISRESTKGVLVLMLKALSDYIKYSSEAQCQMSLNQCLGKTSGMTWVTASNGEEVLVPVENLKSNDIINVHNGEVIPVNGVVSKGTAIVNSIYHTGQPVITHIEENNKVYEGVSVVSGDIKVKVTERIESITKKDIELDKLRINNRVEKYQSKVAILSMVAATASYFITGSAMNSLATILVLCPSASKVAVNTGISNYITLLNKNNIYLRNVNTFEKIIDVDNIVFDKTGTLTYGKMRITSVESFDHKYSKEELLKICAACEINNYHPISVSIQEHVGKDYDLSKLKSSVLIPSEGVSALYEDKRILIGSKEFMIKNGINIQNSIGKYEGYKKKFDMCIMVAIDNKLCGIIAMEDMIREYSRQLIYKLKYKGFNNISILTGDSKENAEKISNKLGIDKVYSGCNYKEKFEIIEELKKYNTVMMVGDGVNDVLAMENADISVSFADSACNKAAMSSDCIIFEEDMDRLADLILLSRKSYKGINNTITFSQMYNLILGGFAILGNFNAFFAKSLNTLNSLYVLILSKRLQLISPGKIYLEPNKNLKSTYQ